MDLPEYRLVLALRSASIFDFTIDDSTIFSWGCGLQWPASTNSVSEVPGVPAAGFALNPNVPNPFNPKATISFNLPTPERVYLRVYEVNSHLFKTLIAGGGSGCPDPLTCLGRDR